MINFKEDESLNKLNHSCAHMMAQAIKHLWPEAKFWVGPVIETGFYYDVDLGEKVITEEDIEAISKEMKKISKDGKRIVRNEISKKDALEQFKDDPYKIDLINGMDEDNTIISTYTQGDFTDLCRGPHVESVKECKYFKLIKFSGAYAKNRDHRKLGKDLGIFFTNDLIGKGLPMYLPNGYIIWEELENYIKGKEKKLKSLILIQSINQCK